MPTNRKLELERIFLLKIGTIVQKAIPKDRLRSCLTHAGQHQHA